MMHSLRGFNAHQGTKLAQYLTPACTKQQTEGMHSERASRALRIHTNHGLGARASMRMRVFTRVSARAAECA
eukprot:787527-Pleurochrysis_carterae.AAC.1